MDPTKWHRGRQGIFAKEGTTSTQVIPLQRSVPSDEHFALSCSMCPMMTLAKPLVVGTGVSRKKKEEGNKERWLARISVDGRDIPLGYYGSEINLAKMYDQVAREMNKPRSTLDFPDDGDNDVSHICTTTTFLLFCHHRFVVDSRGMREVE